MGSRMLHLNYTNAKIMLYPFTRKGIIKKLEKGGRDCKVIRVVKL
jgi:hypothetical protein